MLLLNCNHAIWALWKTATSPSSVHAAFSTHVSFVKQDVGDIFPLVTHSLASCFSDLFIIVGEPAVSWVLLCHIYIDPITDVVTLHERNHCYMSCHRTLTPDNSHSEDMKVRKYFCLHVTKKQQKQLHETWWWSYHILLCSSHDWWCWLERGSHHPEKEDSQLQLIHTQFTCWLTTAPYLMIIISVIHFSPYLVGGNHQVSEEVNGVMDLLELERRSEPEALQVQHQHSRERRKIYAQRGRKQIKHFCFYSSPLLLRITLIRPG